MLMGIVVKNAIVLVDYTKQLRFGGMSVHEAVVTGANIRLRPILMTTLTTIFGMVPLAVSQGEGSEIWNALGITVIGGLLLRTCYPCPRAAGIFHCSWIQTRSQGSRLKAQS